jgi:hypothetical protein
LSEIFEGLRRRSSVLSDVERDHERRGGGVEPL